MKEHPILFSEEMVKTILEGRKCQTRRIVKAATDDSGCAASVHPDGSGRGWIAWWPRQVSAEETRKLYPGENGFKCPYGEPGDRLWVREPFGLRKVITVQGEMKDIVDFEGPLPESKPHDYFLAHKESWKGGLIKWRSPIHMPRWASRISLEITNVRVERIQEISQEDALAEGVVKVRDACYVIRGFDYDLVGLCHTSPITPFAKLWDSINEDRGFGWEVNPWVWVISFKRVLHMEAAA